MKKLLSIILVVCICASLFIPSMAASGSVSQQTAEQTIRALGIMSGDENGSLNLSANVTRAEFCKMMVSASNYKNSVGTSNVSPFKDVKYTHWAAGYIKTAVDAGWIVGYVNGSFLPNNTIKLEEAASALLKLLGYTSSDLTGTYPSAQLAKFNDLKLDEGITKARGEVLTRGDCVYIFYNLMNAQNSSGTVYASSLGYSLNTAGEIDYSKLISEGTKGPYVADGSGWFSVLPFSAETASVYRNGKASDISAVSKYDVFYYNSNIRTIWVYSTRITGLYTAASPSVDSPTSVTVAGNSYTIGTSSATYKLSSMGEFSIGENVMLLLGKEGDIVDVVSSDSAVSNEYGIVTLTGTETYSSGDGTTKTVKIASVACTDGVVRKYEYTSDSLTAADLVAISTVNGAVTVKELSDKNLEGTFNSSGTMIGDLSFADDAQIIDTDDNSNYKIIYPSRLGGTTLKDDDVRYYTLDDTGKINHMILGDATGDLHTYAIVTYASEVDEGMAISSSYKYLVNGTETAISSATTSFEASTGPAVINFGGAAVKSIKNLKGVKLDSINELYAINSNKKYMISDSVEVYISKGSTYTLSALTSVSDLSKYTLYGYYDSGFDAGGRIRIIIATEK